MDLGTARLTVARARVMAGTVTTGRPKTKAGARVIGLGPSTVAALKTWKRRRATERLAAGPARSDTGYVFTNELASPSTRSRSPVRGPERSSRWGRP